jgi:glycosyltransferase involved in cell wall biosynthesis
MRKTSPLARSAGWWVRRLRGLPDPTDRLRIVHVVSSLLVGGMEHFVVRIAAAQARRGNWAGVLALRDGPLSADADRLGVPVWSLGGRTLPGRVKGGVACALRWVPDVLHVHNVSSLHYGTLLATLVGCPLMMTYHGQGKRFPRQPRRVEWKALDLAIAVSRAAAADLRPHIPAERLRVIHNGIDMPPPRGVRASMRHELGLGDTPALITVARMDGLKGHSDLLHALACLRERDVRATALLAGDGSERPALEARARELGLGDEWVRFLGFRTDVADLLEAADVFVLPSLSEGLPLSLLEAMARGLAVVSTQVGGIPEVVTDQREALLVPPRAPEVMAQALARVIGDLSFRQSLAHAAAERVRVAFSLDSMLDRYQELYRTERPSSD